jgi:cell wall-associated NlpC family hydrolase
MPESQTSCEEAIAMFMRTLKQVGKWYQSHPLNKIVGPLTSPNKALQVVDLAKSFVGYPYVWAGADPELGFDCSGLVYYVYKQMGYNIQRDGDGQAGNGIAVKESDMQPGDIIIFANKYTGAIQHVGLYIGDGMMVHAQSSRTGVVISRYDYDKNKYIYTIRRIIY